MQSVVDLSRASKDSCMRTARSSAERERVICEFQISKVFDLQSLESDLEQQRSLNGAVTLP